MGLGLYIAAGFFALAVELGAWVMFCQSASEVLKEDNWLKLLPLYFRDAFLIPRLILILSAAFYAAASYNENGSESAWDVALILIVMLFWATAAVLAWIRLIRKSDM